MPSITATSLGQKCCYR